MRARSFAAFAAPSLLLALVALATACSWVGEEPETANVFAPSIDEGGDLAIDDGHKRTLRLGITDSTGSRVTSAIAENLIEYHLQYPVELVEVGRMGVAITDLERGDLDAMVEVWPTNLEPEDRVSIETGPIVDLGLLGPVGRVGWFVPRRVLDSYPAAGSWEGIADPSVAAIFAGSGAGEVGQFVGIDQSYEQHDSELIEALGLHLQLQYSGSEEASIAMLSEASEQDEPILVYWWSPSSTIEAFDLVAVSLPPRNQACLAAFETSGLNGCAYPREPLWKIGSPSLAERSPEAFRLLRRLEISEADQNELSYQVDYEGVGVQTAAREWIAANHEIWRPWLAD